MQTQRISTTPGRARTAALVFVLGAGLLASCSKTPERPAARDFATPEDAVKALATAVDKGKIADVVAIFGAEGQDLIDSSDAPTARKNREVFSAAMAEGWRLVDEGNRKTLVIGGEAWPFPVPLVKSAGGWRFDTPAGKEEVLVRRIGRNELGAIQVCRTYVAAQHMYARLGHDGKPPGRYALLFRSEPGRHNGLYWPAARGEVRSPLGDLMSEAAEDRPVLAVDRPAATAERRTSSPFHGYFFRILTSQGANAAGGARSYLKDGEFTGGFALIAWPAMYDSTGIMTFVVNQDGVVYQKDLGMATDRTVGSIASFDPDASWSRAE